MQRNTGLVGDPCVDVSQCTAISDGTPECLTNVMVITFPNGYCTGSGCTPGNACDNATGVCVDIQGLVQYCLKPCAVITDCRHTEGYVCDTVNSSSPDTYCIPASFP